MRFAFPSFSPGEMARAQPVPATDVTGCGCADAIRLTFERNAYRNRCFDLQRMIGFLVGKPPAETEADARILELEAQRDALFQLLNLPDQLTPA